MEFINEFHDLNGVIFEERPDDLLRLPPPAKTATKRRCDSNEQSSPKKKTKLTPSQRPKYKPNAAFQRATRSKKNHYSPMTSSPFKNKPLNASDEAVTHPPLDTVKSGFKIKLSKTKSNGSDSSSSEQVLNNTDTSGDDNEAVDLLLTAQSAVEMATPTRTNGKRKASALGDDAHHTDSNKRAAVTSVEDDKPIAGPSTRSKGKGKAPVHDITDDTDEVYAYEAAATEPTEDDKPVAGPSTRPKGKGKAPVRDLTADDDDNMYEAAADEPESEHELETATRKTRGNTKGKGKGKAPAVSTTANFNGTPTGMGTSSNAPAGAPLTNPWHCANRSCTSGQTWHERDGAAEKAHGRKVISNFFGRNKKETNYIEGDVWHNFCRKDYQRGTYRVEKSGDSKARCQYYIDNIDLQLTRLQIWRPEARFKVQLTSGAQKRLNKYYGVLSKNGNDVTAAEAAVHVTAEMGKKGVAKPLKLEDAFLVKYLDHFSSHFCGENFGYGDLLTINTWIQGLVDAGEITTMPPMEFLINKLEDGEANVTDAADNYALWVEQEDATSGAAGPSVEEEGDEEAAVEEEGDDK